MHNSYNHAINVRISGFELTIYASDPLIQLTGHNCAFCTKASSVAPEVEVHEIVVNEPAGQPRLSKKLQDEITTSVQAMLQHMVPICGDHSCIIKCAQKRNEYCDQREAILK